MEMLSSITRSSVYYQSQYSLGALARTTATLAQSWCYEFCTMREPYNLSRQCYDLAGEVCLKLAQESHEQFKANLLVRGTDELAILLLQQSIKYNRQAKIISFVFSYVNRFYVSYNNVDSLEIVIRKCFVDSFRLIAGSAELLEIDTV